MATKNSTKRSNKSKRKESRVSVETLGRWNKWLAVIFAVQGVAILIASAAKAYPITTSYLGVDTLQTQAQGQTVLATGTQTLFTINLAYVVAAFLFIAAVAHVLMVTKLRARYERDVKAGMNRIRWIEYGLSAGVMAMAVGLLVGMQDISSLLMLFGLTLLANLFGLVMDMRVLDIGHKRWLSYGVAGVAGLLPWIVIAIYLISGAVYGSVPAYVWWVSVTMFVFFAIFVANAFAQHRKVGQWADYPYGEQLFMATSLAAKTTLAWLIFVAVLHP